MECKNREIDFNEDTFDYLMDNYYEKLSIPLNGCHPRDILEQIEIASRYYQQPPLLTSKNIDLACRNYFLEN